MWTSLVNPVITTGHSLHNTYNQLRALQYEKRVLQISAGQLMSSDMSLAQKETLSHIQVDMQIVTGQIRQIQTGAAGSTVSGDRIDISDAAKEFYTITKKRG